MPPSDEASREETIRGLYTELALHPASDFGWGKGIENARPQKRLEGRLTQSSFSWTRPDFGAAPDHQEP